jgi:thymidylate synthase (FAD)
MKLIKPSYQILTKLDGPEILRNIEVAGRTCYKSEEKITEDSAEALAARLIKSGHHSVIEHQSFSVRLICDRGVSHEVVRHRLASFSQESTRYCNYSKDKFDNQLTFILPPWCDIAEGEYKVSFFGNTVSNPHDIPILEDTDLVWFLMMAKCEKAYNTLIQEGWKPQEARSVLPNSLKTEIVVTANLREWRTIFSQRCAIAAHPQMRELMQPLLAEVQSKIPIIFNEI